MFWAAAIANLSEFAVQAVLGKCIALVRSEFPLLRAFRHFTNGSVSDIAKVVLRVWNLELRTEDVKKKALKSQLLRVWNLELRTEDENALKTGKVH